MPAPVLQFKRGIFSNLPGLRTGEPGFTTDSYELYVGIDSTTQNNKFFGSHRYWTRETTTTGSGVNLVEGSNNGSDYITLASPGTVGAAVTYYFPAANGNASSVLTNDGSGNLSWASGSANPVFTGIATFTDTTDNTLGDENTGAVQIDGGVGIAKNLTVKENLHIGGYAEFVGVVTFKGGTINLGDAATDNIAVTGEFTSNLVPNTDATSDLGITTQRWKTLNVINVDTTNLAGTAGTITTFDSTTGTIINLNSTNGTITNLTGTAGTITTFDSTTGTIINLNSTNGTITNLTGTAGTITTFDSTTGTIINLNSTNGTITNLTGTAGTITTFDSTTGTITNLNSTNGTITNLTGTAGTITTFDSTTGTITNLNSTNGTVTNLTGTAGTITTFNSTVGTVTNLASTNVSVSGLSTFTGIGTFGNDLFVGGDLQITGNDIKSSTGAVAITLAGNDVTVADDLTVSGNLFVNGSTTQVNTAALTVEDRTIDLGIVDGAAPSGNTTWDLGILFNYYSSSAAKKSAVIWEHGDARFKFASVLASDTDGSDVNTPQLTVTTFAPVEIGQLWVTDCAGTSQVISCTGSTRNLENITVDCGTF
jgi:trimeric autotransporter adhesin